MESSKFLKSGTGEYLTGRQGKARIPFSGRAAGLASMHRKAFPEDSPCGTRPHKPGTGHPMQFEAQARATRPPRTRGLPYAFVPYGQDEVNYSHEDSPAT